MTQSSRSQILEFSAFKKIVHQVVRDANGAVVDIFAPNVAPNFYAANVSLPEHGNVAVLCNLEEVWAFSSGYEEGVCKLAFLDCDPLAGALRNAFQIEAMTESSLNGAFEKQPFHEDSDIRYWKPKTLGEGLFNWWD